MKRGAHTTDKPLLILIAVLVFGGCLIFASAAFGLLARGSTNISSVVFNHLVLGVGLGLVAMTIMTFIDYRFWRKYAPYIYVLALIATAAVFIPHVGTFHGGGRRWIEIAGFSFQPSEGLKIATILLASTYFAAIKGRISTYTYGLGGFLALLAMPAAILVLQPDIGTLGVISFATLAIFIAGGAPWRHIFSVAVLGILVLSILFFVKPYIRDRIETFINPAHGQQNQSYQIKQSLIAVGSGGLVGRGFGQGIQKFTYLPEPMGDSIFAVAGEELGFVGGASIVILFMIFALRGYTVGARAPDMFGSLLAIGIATYLVIEAFINIASMLGVAPLTGIPLTFVSQGGSAMLASLGSAGLLLSVSRASKRPTKA